MANGKSDSRASIPGGNWAKLKAKLQTSSEGNSKSSSSRSKMSPINGSTGGSSPSDGSSKRPSSASEVGMSSKQAKRAKMNEFAWQQMTAKRTKKALSGMAGFMPNGNEVDGQKNGESSASGTRKVKVGVPATSPEEVALLPIPENCKDQPLVEELRTMLAGKSVLNESRKAIAIDCEMVGAGYMGNESCLARVSIVNYHGHILLDTFVQPRESVTDWRTWISGIRPQDVVGAPEFDVVQRQVSGLCKERVVIGHALENDFKALLFSHPGPMVRDTQNCKALRESAKNKKPGLKKLAEIELGVQIQKGPHSSVTDARATMALYRLHKTEWEQQLRPQTEAYKEKMGIPSGPSNKRKRGPQGPATASGEVEEGAETGAFEDEGGLLHAAQSEKTRKGKSKRQKAGGDGVQRGISSGITEIIRHRDGTKEIRGSKRVVSSTPGNSGKWWEEGVD